MAVHAIVPDAHNDVVFVFVGRYRFINPPFLVVPGAVAIEQILSIVHVNHVVFFVGVIIAG